MTGVNLELNSSGDNFDPIFRIAPRTLGPPPPNSTDFSNSGSTFILKNSSGKSSESSSSSLPKSIPLDHPDRGTKDEDILDKFLPLDVVLKTQRLNIIC